MNLDKELTKILPKQKKGGIVTNTIMGVGGLIIGVIVILVITSTLLTANLLTGGENTTAGLTFNDTAQNLSADFLTGLANVGAKIPTILLIVAVVFLFGALVLLVNQARAMGVGDGGSL